MREERRDVARNHNFDDSERRAPSLPTARLVYASSDKLRGSGGGRATRDSLFLSLGLERRKGAGEKMEMKKYGM